MPGGGIPGGITPGENGGPFRPGCGGIGGNDIPGGGGLITHVHHGERQRKQKKTLTLRGTCQAYQGKVARQETAEEMDHLA